jgi:cobalt-zinc-cadmium efflux system outer membrane protein
VAARPAIATDVSAVGAWNADATSPIQPASFLARAGQKNGEGSVNGGNGNGTKQQITLPVAVQMCVNNNFRVLAGSQSIGIAQADLLTSSLMPNPTLFADYQLIPVQHVDINNQLGPPEADVLCSIPIDWLLFGKRVAAMEAARLGVEVSTFDHANTVRVQVAQTVDSFYEVLMDEAYFKLSEKNLEELTEIEKLTEDMAKNKKATSIDVDRSKLAVHEALLERHDAELALDLAKAKFRPFIGRTSADPDFELEGSLSVSAVVPPPKLTEAIALAEAHRPDLLSDRKSVDQANATVESERRRAKPKLDVQPGWSYYNQHWMNGMRNGSMVDIGISMSLPITDRNQGNIRKAQVQVVQNQLIYEADRADALAEVEASVATYEDAVEHLTLFNTAETLQAARDLRKGMEAAYRNGDRKLVELLDAHKAYRDRLAHVIEFESTYWRALHKLNAAVGLNAQDPSTGATEPLGKK